MDTTTKPPLGSSSDVTSAPVIANGSQLTADQAFNRLSLPFAIRLPLLTIISGGSGMLLGMAYGGQESGLRFRAENAHRLPDSQAGWFLYHKSKNYHMMLGGIVEGVKMGTRVAIWATIFAAMEEGVDRGRAAAVRSWRSVRRGRENWSEHDDLVASNRDFASTMLAGLGTAGVFSAWNRFPIPTAVRVAKLGAKVGLAFGVTQDIVSLLRGRPVVYVEFLKRMTIGRSGVAEVKSISTADAP